MYSLGHQHRAENISPVQCQSKSTLPLFSEIKVFSNINNQHIFPENKAYNMIKKHSKSVYEIIDYTFYYYTFFRYLYVGSTSF